jgi:hypothetical protein
MKLKIWLPFCTSDTKPMEVIVKKTASVEEVIGFVLYEYVEAGRLPLPSTSLNVYSLMIVEDDGAVDEDLPGKDIFNRQLSLTLLLLIFSPGSPTKNSKVFI